MNRADAATSSNQAKYESGNPIQLALIRRFQREVCELLAPHRFETVLDVGCGEGFLSRVLLDRFPGIRLTGVDLSAEAAARAAARCPEGKFRAARVEELAAADERYDLVVCSEVLEHLADPAAALTTLQRLASGHALLTVPWEPWFQLANFARGKYLRGLGNHPEHIQHWSLRAFERQVAPAFERIHAGTSFPWIVFFGASRGAR